MYFNNTWYAAIIQASTISTISQITIWPWCAASVTARRTNQPSGDSIHTSQNDISTVFSPDFLTVVLLWEGKVVPSAPSTCFDECQTGYYPGTNQTHHSLSICNQLFVFERRQWRGYKCKSNLITACPDLTEFKMCFVYPGTSFLSENIIQT